MFIEIIASIEENTQVRIIINNSEDTSRWERWSGEEITGEQWMYLNHGKWLEGCNQMSHEDPGCRWNIIQDTT